MKKYYQLMKYLGLSAIFAIAIFSGIPAIAECKDGWCKGGCDEKRCMKVKVISKKYPIIAVRLSNNRGIGNAEYNCKNYKYRFIRDDGTMGEWNPSRPNTPGRKTIEVACKM